jgi:hypothetical protein
MPLQLSGYLPAEELDGLSRLTPELIERFEAAYSEGGGDIEVVIVGVLVVETVKHNRHPEEKPPTPLLKFQCLEAGTGKRADQLRWVIGALKSDRNGQPPLDGFDEAIAAMLEGRDDVPPPPPLAAEPGQPADQPELDDGDG